LALSPGAPAGSYALSKLETINAYNGNLSFRLPLFEIGGRGSAGYVLSLPIETHWRTFHKSNDFQMIELPISNWWSYKRHGYGAGQLQGRVGTDTDQPCPPMFHTTRLLTRLTFSAPDGTEYELRDQLTGGQPQSYFCGGIIPYPSRGTVFVTADGTSATFISDTTIRDDGSGMDPTGYLSLRDGTRYRIVGGDVMWMRDRNGNQIKFAYSAFEMTVTDSLNRQVHVTYADIPSRLYDEITYNGYGGAQRTIRVNYAPLQSVLRTNRPGDLPNVQSALALFPQLTGSTAPSNPYVTSSVVLQDGVQQYQFLYNVYGELARVTLPTGGAYEYDFGNGVSGEDPTGVIWSGFSLPEIYRRVLRRRAYSDQGTTLESLTTYSRPENETPGYVQVDHLKADQATLLARERHYFYGAASGSFSLDPLSYSAWSDGKEYKTEYYATNGQTLLKSVLTTWDQRPLFWWNGSANTAPANNPYVTEVLTTLADTGQVSKTSHINPQTGQVAIDQFNNVNDTWVYDFGQGTFGNLLNHKHTDYLTVNNGVDYSNRTSLSSPHLLSLVTRQSVYDAVGIERARATFEYDNYSGADNFHAPLKNWPAITGIPITGLDSSFNPTYLFRGNVTATTRYLLANGQVVQPITSYSQFDLAGNMVKNIDARSTAGNIIATNISFDDCFGGPDSDSRTNTVPAPLSSPQARTYAFPTVTSNALDHKAYTQFDYFLGRPVNVEDANGTVYSAAYSDSFDRVTRVIRAVNRDDALQSLTTFSYDDALHQITTTADLNSLSDQMLSSQQIYDGLGRTIETRQFEGGGNFIAERRTYDALNRVVQSSNPFRPWKNEAPTWSTSVYDSLGRVESVTTSDGAIARQVYTGNEVLTIDQILKKRKTLSDALGRITKVYEDPDGLNWLTAYNYDALGDLITVTQGSQTRTFQYDSLARLTSSINPESGTRTYVYDNNGNLVTSVNARGIGTIVSYDALNRPTAKTYQNDPANTPAVSFFYDSQALPDGAPADFARGSSIGRLVGTTYGNSGGEGDYFGYDMLGRTVSKVQRTVSVNYPVTARYNASSRLRTVTYPSGHTVTFSYDGAGRLGDSDPQNLAMTGDLGDGIVRTYSSGITYTSRNALAQERFGTETPIYNKLYYNSRGQLAEIRESTSANNSSWNRGAIINHYSNNCWGMCTNQNMPDNNGNLKRQEHWIPDKEAGFPFQTFTQVYQYDDLNRLRSVSETRYVNDANPTFSFTQAYSYDRYGNRSIDQAGTTPDAGINTSQASVVPNTLTNRIYGPGETETNHPLINYDSDGNQTRDYYSDNGTRFDRVFDAESRLIASTVVDSLGGKTSSYSYDGNGARVRRYVNGQEMWMVYGIGGELLAEYTAKASPETPSTEYGYRNGQLLISAAGVVASPPTDIVDDSVDDFVSGSLGRDGSGNTGLWWLVHDQLGTPRMIFDQSGRLANMRRHDYLPFGEELGAGVGSRDTGQGYLADGIRQKFTQKERDSESNLDYFMARHYQSAQGRFISPDPLLASGRPANPQTWNRYAYVLNNPLRFIDPNGLVEVPIPTLDDFQQQNSPQQPLPTPSPVQQPLTNQSELTFTPIPLTTFTFYTEIVGQPSSIAPLDGPVNDVMNRGLTLMANNDLSAMNTLAEMQLHPGTGSSFALTLSLQTGLSPGITWAANKTFYVHSPEEVLLQTGIVNRNIQGSVAAALIPMESWVATCERGRLGGFRSPQGNLAATLADYTRDRAQTLALRTFQERNNANPPPGSLPR
jgi:RHS repeat-associated protein